jgi:hypothetical protein
LLGKEVILILVVDGDALGDLIAGEFIPNKSDGIE